LARWEMAFFRSAPIWAKVQPMAGT
jgi:hypothetical protein